MTNLQTKQSVKSKKITAKEAYDKLLALVGEMYADSLPTMIWLNNLINGKKVVKENAESRQDKKEAFRKKIKNNLLQS